MMNIKKAPWVWVAGGVASVASVLVWANRRMFVVNDVTAGRTEMYPEIKPHAYAYPASQVFAVAEATAREMPRWRVTSVDRLGREAAVEAQLPLFGFVDDVTIRVDPIEGSKVCEVIVRSRSRTGSGDLGENARRIVAFYRALDERIRNSGVPAEPAT